MRLLIPLSALFLTLCSYLDVEAATFKLSLTSGKARTGITIINSTWNADDPNAFGVKSGPTVNVDGDLQLKADTGIYSIEITAFGKGPAVGDTGDGEKRTDDGAFPVGKFKWECVE